MFSGIYNYAILISTILLYFNSRVDANVFKVVFVFFFALALILKLKSDFKVPRGFVFFVIFILVNIAFFPKHYAQSLSTLSYFSIIFLLYYFYMLRANLIDLVNDYVGFCFFLAVIALIQEVLFLIDHEWIFYISKHKNPDFWYFPGITLLRVASLLDEPSKLGLYLLPALLLGIGKLYFKNIEISIKFPKIVVIFLAFILTFSAHAFLSLLLSISALLFYLKHGNSFKKYFVVIGFVLLLPLVLSHDAVSEKLVNASVFSSNFDSSTSTSATSGFYYVGSRCVLDIVTKFKIFGVGMGNYSEVAEPEWKKIGKIVVDDDGSTIGYARIIVEFGIVGIVLFSIFMCSSVIRSASSHQNIKVNSIMFVNRVAFLFVAVTLFRMGFYVNPPIIFFISLLLISKMRYRNNVQQEKQ